MTGSAAAASPDSQPSDDAVDDCDASLAAVTVGGPFEFDGRIVIEDYDPRWPGLFEREAARIRAALGAAALSVEHVGSTSVPGLAAKPIVDIDLIVADSADAAAYVPALEAAGYVLRLREPDWHEHRMFKGPDTDVNLHVFGPDAAEPGRHNALRDWLRVHPEDRDLYARTKRELSERRWKHSYLYAEAKSQVIGEILQRAGRS
jgi:GrpB-like predicted nucleotidyltransferase (UPF0157 family)